MDEADLIIGGIIVVLWVLIMISNHIRLFSIDASLKAILEEMRARH